ncbi:hypothetical protein K1719_019640 [Acacia pycnantha]|nr:hypothetical protein K1719_019640 [Acacia pycnantha]
MNGILKKMKIEGFGTFTEFRSLVFFALISKDFCFLVFVAVSYGRNISDYVTFQWGYLRLVYLHPEIIQESVLKLLVQLCWVCS